MRAFGAEYEAAWPVLVALSAAALPMVLNLVLGQAFISTGSIWSRMALDLLLAVTLAASSWWLIPRAGARPGDRERPGLLRHLGRAGVVALETLPEVLP